jgi:hypothetical protein
MSELSSLFVTNSKISLFLKKNLPLDHRKKVCMYRETLFPLSLIGEVIPHSVPRRHPQSCQVDGHFYNVEKKRQLSTLLSCSFYNRILPQPFASLITGPSFSQVLLRDEVFLYYRCHSFLSVSIHMSFSTFTKH